MHTAHLRPRHETGQPIIQKGLTAGESDVPQTIRRPEVNRPLSDFHRHVALDVFAEPTTVRTVEVAAIRQDHFATPHWGYVVKVANTIVTEGVEADVFKGTRQGYFPLGSSQLL